MWKLRDSDLKSRNTLKPKGEIGYYGAKNEQPRLIIYI